MYIIIVGAGKIGRHLAEFLIEEDHDVVVVDQNGDVCHEVASKLDVLTIRGDATTPEVLEDAGVGEADSIVSLTGSDETNLIVGLIAKQLGAEDVGIKLGATHYDKEVLKRLGIDRAIYPELNAAGYISEMLTKPEVLDLTFLERGNAVILELEVGENSRVIGNKLEEIEEAGEVSVVSIYEDDELIIPSPQREIKKGDKLLVLTQKEKSKAVEELVKG